MRDVRDAISHGTAHAATAVAQFAYVIRKFIGSYMAVLGGLDLLVFTGGIGENDIQARLDICAGLEPLGVVLDPARNNVRGKATISADSSRVRVEVIPPAEDLLIVLHTYRLMSQPAPEAEKAREPAVSA